MPKLLFLYLHIVSFAAYAGSAVAAGNILKNSKRPGLDPAGRLSWLTAGASTITKVELPFAFALILTGVGLLLMTPGFMKAAWMHMKLTLVLIAVILTHLKMFNAKRMVKAAMAGQTDELMARGKRQFVFGMMSLALGLLIVGLAVFKPFSFGN